MELFPDLVNRYTNRLHEWGEPQHDPLIRFFIPRLGNVGMIGVEALATLSSVSACIKCAVTKVWRILFCSGTEESLSKHLLDVGKRIIGVVSTIFFGVVFSPETNFRIHLALGLVGNNLAMRKQHLLEAKLLQEAEKAANEKRHAELLETIENPSNKHDAEDLCVIQRLEALIV